MRFLRRFDNTNDGKPVEGWKTPAPQRSSATNSAEPPPAPEPEREWHVDLETVDGARLSIVELKRRKHELQALKKEVAAEQAEVRATHAETRAGRVVMPRGGGTLGRMVRGSVQASRRSDRMRMQEEIQAYNDQKAAIDYDIREIDAAILRCQRFIDENAPVRQTRAATPKLASADDIAERLKALEAMRAAGLITEEECSSKRADVLARL